MNYANQRKKQAKTLRIFRKVHRLTGLFLFIFFIIIAVTGILLGWKKNSGGLILSQTSQGTSSEFEHWLPLDSLYKNALKILADSVGPDLNQEVDRIDIRKEKGIVKFTFKDHFWGLQIDGTTGKVLHIERRRADFIEKVHDGSILDYYFNTSGDQMKLVYTSVLGIALLTFTITGFWLWYGPKRMRRKKN
jgi:uncharacterized iron-regulated membrane protein